jgi:predicted RNA-binding Zn-ribbon protein involved in translation (DUF1610 family)
MAITGASMAVGTPIEYLLAASLGCVVAGIVGLKVSHAPVPDPIEELRRSEVRKVQEQRQDGPTFAERTGQARRLWVTQSLLVLGGATYMASWFVPESIEPFKAAGSVLAVIGFVGLCLAVWCPKCGTAVIWYTLLRQRSGSIRVAAAQIVCPRCGFDPD